jgi:DNA-binding IclR family transcriptional regulator
VLRELRTVLAEHDGAPVRIEVLARRLGTDPATVRAMVDHARRRGLIALTETGPALDERCVDSSCAGPCRHCPLARPGRPDVPC